MGEYIAAIDQGTTSSRCIIFNRKGEIKVASQKEHQQLFPRAGWVEHNALEIWQNTQEVISESLKKSGLKSSDLCALGITNQRETIVFWDKTNGWPLCNAIVWQDTRSNDICERLSHDVGKDRFRETTGLPLATYFSGPKIKWAIENNPAVKESLDQGNLLVGTIDTWLIWNLTGGPRGGQHITDVTNASRTQLMDIHTLRWDEAILSILQIPASILPRIVPSSQNYGLSIDPLAGVPICSAVGDQQAALIGQTCFSPGEAKNTYGTGCFLLLNTGEKPVSSKSGLLTTLAYQLGNQPPVYCLEGSIAITGALVQWLRDNLNIIQNSSEIEPLAASVPDNGGVYFVPAFSGLYAPHWRGDARGVIVGMSRYTTKAHIARAALEATAFQTREIFDAMEKDSNVHLKALKVDGGMVNNNLLMQFQSDLLNAPVVRPRVSETTALGAAYAAGLAVGFWSGFDDLRQNWQKDKEWKPSMKADIREDLYRHWKKAVTRTFDWVE
ncbi:MAG: glycerol kinase GlpK [Anaerolineaceae bacterium]